MNTVFYLTAGVAVVATILVITNRNAVHALLLFVLSLLSIGLLFFLLGAPFVAALEVIIYAGAIMVMFLFVVMMLDLGGAAGGQERYWTRLRGWIAPAILCAVLAGILGWIFLTEDAMPIGSRQVEPKEVGAALFGPYIWGVHVAALLLLSGLIGASHLRRHDKRAPDSKGGE